MKYLVIFDDYTGLPRAWGLSSNQKAAESRARKELATYCKRQEGIEPELAQVKNYTRRIVRVKEGDQ